MQSDYKADIVIVGAGVVGSTIARELSKYKVDTILIDKNEDIGGYASRGNSGTLSTGHDCPPGSLEQKLTIGANHMYPRILQELDVKHKKCGTICVALNDDELSKLNKLYKISIANGVYAVEKISRDKCLELEPMLSQKVVAGLLIPDETIVDVFELVFANIENAMENGLRLMLSTKALSIQKDPKQNCVTSVVTDKGVIRTQFVVNAAAIYADELAKTVGFCDYRNYPRTGQYWVLDKNLPYCPSHIIIPLPTPISRGRIITPTVHENLLVGPSAVNGWDKEDTKTDEKTLKSILADCRKMIPDIDPKDSIAQYTGVRPAKCPKEWAIRATEVVKGYIEAVGISQGVSSAPAIAVYLCDILDNEGLILKQKKNFNRYRASIRRFSELSESEKNEYIQRDSRYGNVICRCETVTEAEIVQAIHKGPGARSLDSIKRRLRAGAGRCQGGFCSPRVIEILARELEVPEEMIRKNDPGSEILVEKVHEAGRVK